MRPVFAVRLGGVLACVCLFLHLAPSCLWCNPLIGTAEREDSRLQEVVGILVVELIQTVGESSPIVFKFEEVHKQQLEGVRLSSVAAF